MMLAMRRFLQGRRDGLVRFKVSAYLQSDDFGHQNGNGVANLLVLRYAGTDKFISIGERLKACRFAYGERALLVRKKHRPPVRIAFRHDGASEAVIAQPAIALGVI